MSFKKSAVAATLVAAIALGAGMTAANAGSKHKNTRNFLYGAAAATAVIAIANESKRDCKKWKYRYERTGNPYYLDRYYDCR